MTTRSKAPTALLALVASSVAACGGPATTIPLLHSAGAPTTFTPSADVPLEIVTRATAVRDPLPVRNSDVTYAELETTLGLALGSGLAPFANADRFRGRGGYQLTVELVDADAREEGERFRVGLDVRATLRERDGGRYVAQTRAVCDQATLAPPDRGAPTFFSCMTRLGRDLGGWLSGVDLTRPAPAAP